MSIIIYHTRNKKQFRAKVTRKNGKVVHASEAETAKQSIKKNIIALQIEVLTLSGWQGTRPRIEVVDTTLKTPKTIFI